MDTEAVSEPQPSVRSELTGSAGNVVQARDVTGGVHIHHFGARGNGSPRQLPADVRAFVNRVAEVGQLDRLLDREANESEAPAIVLITGAAGVGKTSLAVHWAHRVRNVFADGQLYLNLRGYDPGVPVTPEAALNLFLQALGVPPRAVPADPQAKASLYRSLVADRRFLVVLDNAATVGQVRPLLPGTASCLVLVTSRSRMPALIARDGAVRMTVGVLDDGAAIKLLRAVMAGHRTGDDADRLSELARLCARLPLALRIAAERAAARPWMALAELIDDLRDESALWDALSSADEEEADAVRTVFAWSYRALPPATARLFRVLGLHLGAEFGLGATAALAGTTAADTRHLLDALLAVHLLEQTGPDRYQLHDLLRAYAVDQVRREDPAEERRAATHRLLSWYLHTAHEAGKTVVRGHRQMPISLDRKPELPEVTRFAAREEALNWYEADRTNLMAATRSAASAGFERIAWQLPVVLNGIYDNRDPAETWLEAEQIALAAARRLGDRHGQALILERLGIKFRKLQRMDEALASFEEAMTVFDGEGNTMGCARVANGLGLVYLRAGRLEEARTTFAGAISGSPAGHAEVSMRAVLLVNLAEAELRLGSPQAALTHIAEAVSVFQRYEDSAMESLAVRLRGAAQREAGLLVEARASLRRALELIRSTGNLAPECEMFLELALLEIAEGAPADALISAQRSTLIARQFDVTSVEAQSLDVTGTAFRALGRPCDAVPFHRRAIELLRGLPDQAMLAEAIGHLDASLERGGQSVDE
jgi:tetratricopeptide (TPR) repeat protein